MRAGGSSRGGGGNSRYIDGEVSTWKNFIESVLEINLEKHTCSGKSMHKVTVFDY